MLSRCLGRRRLRSLCERLAQRDVLVASYPTCNQPMGSPSAASATSRDMIADEGVAVSLLTAAVSSSAGAEPSGNGFVASGTVSNSARLLANHALAPSLARSNAVSSACCISELGTRPVTPRTRVARLPRHGRRNRAR